MELLESDDPKAQLLRQAQQQKQALDTEVKVLSDKTEKVVKTALVVGGALVATYLLYQMLSGSDSKKKKKKKIKIVRAAQEDEDEVEEVKESAVSGILTKMAAMLATQASVFLLSLAKEKIGEYLENKAEKKDADTI